MVRINWNLAFIQNQSHCHQTIIYIFSVSIYKQQSFIFMRENKWLIWEVSSVIGSMVRRETLCYCKALTWCPEIPHPLWRLLVFPSGCRSLAPWSWGQNRFCFHAEVEWSSVPGFQTMLSPVQKPNILQSLKVRGKNLDCWLKGLATEEFGVSVCAVRETWSNSCKRIVYIDCLSEARMSSYTFCS